MKSLLGEIRRSQVITSYGPGSILDFRAGGHGGAGVSVVAAGLEEWDRSAPPPGMGHPQTISEPRLEAKLEVEGFRLPPVAPQVAPGTYRSKNGGLIGVRFPQWLQCPVCHILRHARFWNEDPGDPALYCRACSRGAGGRHRAHVVPVRFIVICDRGHLGEFPWDRWVGHRDGCGTTHDLRLEGSAMAGLRGLILSCLDCGAKRSMEGCFGPKAISQSCQGKRPWLGIGADEDCPADPRVVQRSASNIYFPVIESALDIPPWSDGLQKKIGTKWFLLEKADSSEDRRALIRAMRLPTLTGQSEAELVEVVEDRLRQLRSPDRNLRWEEYQQFTRPTQGGNAGTEFEIRHVTPPPALAPWIGKVVSATRLREVRVNRGFTRVFPPTLGDDERVARISLSPLNWLPGTENRGEGIFIQLNQDRVQHWEKQRDVHKRVAGISGDYRRARQDRGIVGEDPRSITPRFLLIHSLAHMLIHQLSLSCGYSSASLRERLYVQTGDWEMAGLLIFTSSPDSDGTLGGLARQAAAANLGAAFEEGLSSMAWCSSDPLCIGGVHAMSEPANGAACHSCMLASETSCEEFNLFLDRALLVGTPSNPELGYFRAWLAELNAL